MGYSIAKEAMDRGAAVILISGPTSLTPPKGVSLVRINTTEEMLNAVDKYFDSSDVLIKSAAPVDYRPETISTIKIKKKENEKDELNIRYIKNPDIAAHFGAQKKNQIMVGFAAETNNVYEYALAKLKKKNLDFIVANDVTEEGAGFNIDTNIVTIIDKNGTQVKYPMMDKKKVARLILDKVISILEDRS